MINLSKLAVGVCSLALVAPPALAEIDAKASTQTMHTEHRATTMTAKDDTDAKPATVAHHRAVHHRHVHHRRHHTPRRTMKKTTVETSTTTDPK